MITAHPASLRDASSKAAISAVVEMEAERAQVDGEQIDGAGMGSATMFLVDARGRDWLIAPLEHSETL